MPSRRTRYAATTRPRRRGWWVARTCRTGMSGAATSPCATAPWWWRAAWTARCSSSTATRSSTPARWSPATSSWSAGRWRAARRRRSWVTPAYGVEWRAFDDVAPVEDWGLRAGEVGWSAFLFQRDYRDYYLSKGIAGRAFVQPNRSLRIDIEARHDWQTTVRARDPWTVFRNDQAWRPNPPIDDGHYTTLAGTLTFDTRNDRRDPTAGWFLRARFENSRSEDVTPQPGVPAAVRGPIPTDGSYAFSRLFVDFRRYTRVSPSGRVNLRVFAGGWIGGDPLPLQQRLSTGGADPLAGYGFRHSACNGDIIDPAFGGTGLAACDRVILAQAAYRGHIALHWSYGSSAPEAERAKSLFTHQGPDLVVLADAGQAWLVGGGPGRQPADRFLTLGS